jgi:hypothetical protein
MAFCFVTKEMDRLLSPVSHKYLEGVLVERATEKTFIKHDVFFDAAETQRK